MNRPTRTLAALTGAAALSLTGVSPASAASWVHEDAVGDVEAYSWNERTGTETGPETDPDNTDTDVTKVGLRHSARRVVLNASLRDITADSGVMIYKIRTGQRVYHAVQRLGTKRDMGPAFRLYRGEGHRVRCSGARHSVDRTTEQAVVNVPRRCLGRPAWVRLGAGAISYTETRTTFTYRFDEALRDGAGNPDRLALSPRIQRG